MPSQASAAQSQKQPHISLPCFTLRTGNSVNSVNFFTQMQAGFSWRCCCSGEMLIPWEHSVEEGGQQRQSNLFLQPPERFTRGKACLESHQRPQLFVSAASAWVTKAQQHLAPPRPGKEAKLVGPFLRVAGHLPGIPFSKSNLLFCMSTPCTARINKEE